MSNVLLFILVISLSGALMFQLSPISQAQQQVAKSNFQIPDRALHDLRTRMQAYVTDRHVSNLSYGLWQGGVLVDQAGFGAVGQDRSQIVSDTTIYRIRSMTKPVTAVGLLILLERGHFDLDDPITEFLPEFEDTETLADYDADGQLFTYRAPYKPTMRHLLSHTAGFAYWRRNGGIIDERLFAANIAGAADGDAFVHAVAREPYIAMPGSEWNYSVASDLQGIVIERISEQTLPDFLEQELFAPLGMADTGFDVPADKIERLSDVTRTHETEFEYVSVEPADAVSQSNVFAEGGHGLYSTQRDYLQFLNLLRNQGRAGDQQILSPKTLDLFHTNAIKYRGAPGRQRPSGSGAGVGYGLGVGTVEDPKRAGMAAPKGTYYWNSALGTWFWIDPVNDIVFIGMVQSATSLEPDAMKAAMASIYGDGSTQLISAYASEGSG